MQRLPLLLAVNCKSKLTSEPFKVLAYNPLKGAAAQLKIKIRSTNNASEDSQCCKKCKTPFYYFGIFFLNLTLPQRSLSSPDGLVSSMPEDATSRLHLAALGQVHLLILFFFLHLASLGQVHLLIFYVFLSAPDWIEIEP